jgi:rRNA maturation endonuclease Nob1
MIEYKFICKNCKKVFSKEITSIKEYDNEKPNTHDCGGEVERYFGDQKPPGIRTKSSPSRY